MHILNVKMYTLELTATAGTGPLLVVNCAQVSFNVTTQSPPVVAISRNIVTNLDPVQAKIHGHPELYTEQTYHHAQYRVYNLLYTVNKLNAYMASEYGTYHTIQS